MASAPRAPRAPRVRRRDRRGPERAEREPRSARDWLREFQVSGFALAVIAVIVAALVALAPSLKTLVEQQQRIAELEASVQDAQDAVDELNDQIARWDDAAYIESQARDRLFYVYPGDRAYLLMGGDDDSDSGDGLPVSDEIQTTRIDWVSGLLSSVFEAALTDETAEQLDDDADGSG